MIGTAGAAQRTSEPGCPTGVCGRILIVDDAFFIRVLLRTILEEAGHTVVGEASTGLEAVSMYHLFHPDVVLMDISMPDCDGLTAMEEILGTSPEAQVIICTALQFRHIVSDAMSRGARDFITKPFKPEAILQAVDNVLRRQKSRVPDEGPALPGPKASPDSSGVE